MDATGQEENDDEDDDDDEEGSLGAEITRQRGRF